MLGMKKSGKRLLIAPASIPCSSDAKPNRVAPLSTLVYEFEIMRVSSLLSSSFLCFNCNDINLAML